MHNWQSLSHVRWECKYHVVFIPKHVSDIKRWRYHAARWSVQ